MTLATFYTVSDKEMNSIYCQVKSDVWNFLVNFFKLCAIYKYGSCAKVVSRFQCIVSKVIQKRRIVDEKTFKFDIY